MKKTKLVALICIALLPCLAMGQCDPDWLNEPHIPLQNSDIRVISRSASTEDEARNKGLNFVITGQDIATGGRFQIQHNGDITEISGKSELEVKARVLDEYRERNGNEYRVSLLVQTAKNPTFDFENVTVTSTYGFSPRVFVPGYAQINKGSTTKGIGFIVGHAVGIGGIVACEGLRASYQSKINTTHNVKERQKYIDKADTMQNLRNGFIAATAVLYVWNIVDGIVAKGKSHIVIHGNTHLSIVPCIAPFHDSMGGGLSLTFNF